MGSIILITLIAIVIGITTTSPNSTNMTKSNDPLNNQNLLPISLNISSIMENKKALPLNTVTNTTVASSNDRNQSVNFSALHNTSSLSSLSSSSSILMQGSALENDTYANLITYPTTPGEDDPSDTTTAGGAAVVESSDKNNTSGEKSSVRENGLNRIENGESGIFYGVDEGVEVNNMDNNLLDVSFEVDDLSENVTLSSVSDETFHATEGNKEVEDGEGLDIGAGVTSRNFGKYSNVILPNLVASRCRSTQVREYEIPYRSEIGDVQRPIIHEGLWGHWSGPKNKF